MGESIIGTYNYVSTTSHNGSDLLHENWPSINLKKISSSISGSNQSYGQWCRKKARLERAIRGRSLDTTNNAISSKL